MKHAVIKSLAVLSLALGFSAVTTSALACHTSCQKPCYNKGSYTCVWIKEHRHHGVVYEGHYRCWSTHRCYKVKGHYYDGCWVRSQKVCNY